MFIIIINTTILLSAKQDYVYATYALYYQLLIDADLQLEYQQKIQTLSSLDFITYLYQIRCCKLSTLLLDDYINKTSQEQEEQEDKEDLKKKKKRKF